MNEPSNFCEYPCTDPSSEKRSIEPGAHKQFERQNGGGSKKGLPGRDLINPPYKIQNAMGSLSNKTADTDLVHQGGWVEYDTHNL